MNGEPITIDITGLPNSSDFSLLIGATLQVTPGQDFLFETTDFVMPLSLDNGQISATTTGAQKATFSAQKGTTEISMTRAADPGGVFSFSQPQSISAGTFDFIRMEGTPLPDKNTIVSSFQLRGKKTGPDSSSISFTVNGIENGRIQLSINVDGSQALYQTVTIGNGIPSDQPIILPSSTTGVPLSSNITPTLTPGSTNTSSLKTFYSADRNVSLTVQRVDYAGLLTVKASGVPPAWIPMSDAYAITPDSLTFSPPATISFRIPERPDSGPDYAYFIGMFRNNQWVIVPSTAQDNAITAVINGSGTYALMAYNLGSTVAVSSATTPDSVVTSGDNQSIASAVQEQSPQPSATKTPMSVFPVLGALAIGAGIALGKKE